MQENQLSARKTTPTWLTIGIQLTKKIVHITCGMYLTALASHDKGRGDTWKFGDPRFLRIALALIVTRSFVKIRLSALDRKYTISHETNTFSYDEHA